MLITNFASGELSENLFGRTDLRQYYNAAAKMENFDVIPTGGIKRRSGTEQVKKLDLKDGRIIPFVINRKNAFLLYLTPKNILSYKLEGGKVIDVKNHPKEGLRFYETPEHIREIQYAQNFDTMILCHENYPPLEVKLESDNQLSIRTLPFDFEVPIVAGENITQEDIADLDEEKVEKTDKKYRENGWLTTNRNYPVAVSFFNGRLVFAGTQNNRQRVFTSAVKDGDKPYNFSTSKLFLTEKKEYSVLFGEIDPNDTSIIEASREHIVNNFTKPQNKYRIDSTLYDKNTIIEYIGVQTVKLTKGVKDPAGIVDIEAVKNVFNSKITAFDNYNDNATPVKVFNQEYRYRTLNEYVEDVGWEGWIKCAVKGNSIDIYYLCKDYVKDSSNRWGWHVRSGSETVIQDSAVLTKADVVKIIDKDTNTISSRIRTKIISHLYKVKKELVPTPAYGYGPDDGYGFYKRGPTSDVEINQSINNCINELYAHVRDTMYYELITNYGIKKYWGTPLENYADVMDRVENSNKTYIPFYTREVISDSYPTPDCGFMFEIASDMNDSIRWLAVNKGLIIGTETAEWVVPSGVHATNIQAALNSRYGSDKIQGTAIGDATIFFQAGKKRLIEYYIPQADNNFRANDMAMLSPQMLDESPAREFDFISSPHTKLLITREDGAVAALLYERNTGTFAWNRITLGGGGKIRSTAVLPGPEENGNDDVYFVVERGSSWYLERLREDGNVYLDSYSPANAGSGYPYESVLRTMPVLANDKMKKQRIVALLFRFLKSHGGLKMTALAGGRKIQTDTLTGIKPPHSGIFKQTFPGTWDEEIQAELTTDEAAPVKILALNAEMAAGAY